MIRLPDADRLTMDIGRPRQKVGGVPDRLGIVIIAALDATAAEVIDDQEIQRCGSSGAVRPIVPIRCIEAGWVGYASSRRPHEGPGYNRLDRRRRIADKCPHIRHAEYLDAAHTSHWFLKYL